MGSLPERVLAAAGVWSGRDSQPDRKASSILEHGRIAHRDNQPGCDLRPDRLDAHQGAAAAEVNLRDAADEDRSSPFTSETVTHGPLVRSQYQHPQSARPDPVG